MVKFEIYATAYIIGGFEIFLWEKRRIRLCRDSIPGLSIAG